MPFPGPWEQLPDFERSTHTWSPADLRWSQDIDNPAQDFQASYTPVLREAVRTAIATTAFQTVTSSGQFGVQLDVSGQGGDPDDTPDDAWNYTYDKADTGLFVRLLGSLQADGPWPWPEGAIGYEWDEPPMPPGMGGQSTPVALTVEITMYGTGDGPLRVQLYRRPAADPFDTSGLPVLITEYVLTNGGAVEAGADVISFMTTDLGPTGGVAVYPVTVSDEGPGEWNFPAPTEPNWHTDGFRNWTMANVWDPTILPLFTYTLRPPRHRFLYADVLPVGPEEEPEGFGAISLTAPAARTRLVQ